MTGASVLITGVSGQDGQLLVRQLSDHAARIVGVVPPDAGDSQVDDIASATNVSVLRAELADTDVCRALIDDVRPDVVFHLAAISSVGRSWEMPVETSQLNGMSSVALMAKSLELTERGHRVKFVNASSAEIFGATEQSPQNETTPLAPNSPYGVSKAFAHMMADTFRPKGLWVSNAILYNHESTLRPDTFVTRKITKAAVAVATGAADSVRLGNLDARRDWGWAPDYVDCLVRMANHHESGDFVVATGASHSVRDFVATAFAAVGIDDWERHVDVDPGLIRPTDAVELVGDATKAHEVLGWKPSMEFTEIVQAMVAEDLRIADTQRTHSAG